MTRVKHLFILRYMVAGYDTSEERGWFRPESTGIYMNYHKY